VIILGLDPGVNTGVAQYQGGQLLKLHTIAPHQLPDVIRQAGVMRVIFEDSRLQSAVWTTSLSRPAALKMARNVGQIDAWCSLITAVCADLGITAYGISPRGKGAKLNAERFAALTGWEGRTNEHERDAAYVSWRYRSMSA
jgi:hypothetical protein